MAGAERQPNAKDKTHPKINNDQLVVNSTVESKHSESKNECIDDGVNESNKTKTKRKSLNISTRGKLKHGLKCESMPQLLSAEEVTICASTRSDIFPKAKKRDLTSSERTKQGRGSRTSQEYLSSESTTGFSQSIASCSTESDERIHVDPNQKKGKPGVSSAIKGLQQRLQQQIVQDEMRHKPERLRQGSRRLMGKVAGRKASCSRDFKLRRSKSRLKPRISRDPPTLSDSQNSIQPSKAKLSVPELKERPYRQWLGISKCVTRDNKYIVNSTPSRESVHVNNLREGNPESPKGTESCIPGSVSINASPQKDKQEIETSSPLSVEPIPDPCDLNSGSPSETVINLDMPNKNIPNISNADLVLEDLVDNLTIDNLDCVTSYCVEKVQKTSVETTFEMTPHNSMYEVEAENSDVCCTAKIHPRLERCQKRVSAKETTETTTGIEGPILSKTFFTKVAKKDVVGVADYQISECDIVRGLGSPDRIRVRSATESRSRHRGAPVFMTAARTRQHAPAAVAKRTTPKQHKNGTNNSFSDSDQMVSLDLQHQACVNAEGVDFRQSSVPENMISGTSNTPIIRKQTHKIQSKLHPISEKEKRIWRLANIPSHKSESKIVSTNVDRTRFETASSTGLIPERTISEQSTSKGRAPSKGGNTRRPGKSQVWTKAVQKSSKRRAESKTDVADQAPTDSVHTSRDKNPSLKKPPPLKRSATKKYESVQAVADFPGTLPGQLSFRKGQIIKMLSYESSRDEPEIEGTGMRYGYYREGRLKRKRKGLFPSTFVVKNPE